MTFFYGPLYRLIGQVSRVFANGQGDLGSIPVRVIPKILKMVLDASLLNTLQYKVRNKGKVEHSRERRSALLYTSVLWQLKREPSGRSRLRSPTFMDPYTWTRQFWPTSKDFFTPAVCELRM